MPWAIAVARRIGQQYRLDDDDILSAAGYAVANWLHHWKPSKGSATTLLYWWVRQAITHTVSKAGPIPHPYKPVAPIPTVINFDSEDTQRADAEDTQPTDAEDAGPTGIDAAIQHEREEAIRRAVRTLPPRLQTIIHFRFFSQPKPTLAQLGLRLGISRQCVQQLELRALTKLEQQLANL